MNIKKTINIEYDDNDQLTVWPEFDGLTMDEYEERKGGFVLDKATRNEWGDIIAKTIDLFCKKLDLSMESYTRKRKFFIKYPMVGLKTVWEKEFPIDWESGAKVDPKTPQFFNMSVFYNMNYFVLVFKPTSQRFNQTEASISAFHEYINTSVEEAALYCTLNKHEKAFISSLAKVAKEKGYKFTKDKKHFISHAITVNLKRNGFKKSDWTNNRKISFISVEDIRKGKATYPKNNWIGLFHISNIKEFVKLDLKNLFDNGLQYICTVGNNAEELELLFDMFIVSEGIEYEKKVIMTTSHENLREGLWSALHVAFVDGDESPEVVFITDI